MKKNNGMLMTASMANFTNEAKFLPICAKAADVHRVIQYPRLIRSVSLQRVRINH